VSAAIDETARRRRVLRAMCAEVADTEPVYGVDDCSAWPAQWVANITGRTLDMPVWHSRAEAEAMMDDAGGLMPIWDQVLGPAGFGVRAGMPRFGDVGVIKTFGFRDVGVIFCELGSAAWRAHRGGVRFLAPRHHTILKVWAI